MKRTRVPRTVRRDIWRLAMETLSIPSLQVFWSRIRNQIKRRIENRKKTKGPNRKSNRLKYIYIYKKTHALCHSGFLLRLIDVVQCLPKVRTLASYKQSVRGNSKCRFCYFRPNESALRKLCTSINQPYLIWAAVICHVPPPKDQGEWNQQSKNGVGIANKEEAVDVHDEVK